MRRFTLHPQVAVSVLGPVRTAREHNEELGDALQGPASRRLRRALAPLKVRIARLGREKTLSRAQELTRWLESRPGWSALCSGKATLAGRRRLADQVLYPQPVPPRLLHLRRGQRGLDLEVAPGEWPELADLLASLGRGATRQELALFRRGAPGALLAELERMRWLKTAPPPLDFGEGVLFLGHNSALVASRKARLLVDPWLRPAAQVDRLYRPLTAAEVGPVDAIAVTHSHGDHFHPGSLLLFGRETPIVVPEVERETLLCTDLFRCLTSLGFTRVIPMRWGETRRIGDLSLTALPFHGEQPWEGEPLYGLRNQGNTYRVAGPKASAVFLADSGRDHRGEMLSVVRGARADLAFVSIREFRLEPIFYPFTTLDAFFACVPMEALAREVALMTGSAGALAIGEALQARYVVPYADGGAPWYWREGMGPFYPGYPGHPVGRGFEAERACSDPYPERLLEERERRGRGPEPLLLRPGDGVRVEPKLELHRWEGLAWPFGGDGA